MSECVSERMGCVRVSESLPCNDPVSSSGMFCAMATTIERCKMEGVVDVFQV